VVVTKRVNPAKYKTTCPRFSTSLKKVHTKPESVDAQGLMAFLGQKWAK
jgi:hypothetical protein